jgi:hypothetical protein
MLEPERRLTYLELLRPPPGYHLQKAVGTTFSADLETLVYIPLALSSKDGFRDEDGKPNFLALLDSLRRSSRKMALFCQRGRVLLPKSASQLNGFLNHSVFEVNPEKGSFHPKLWVLHYSSEVEDNLYRFVCTSRNATFDNSWDVVLSAEGEYGKRVVGESKHLGDFLQWLSDQEALSIASLKVRMVRELSEEVRHVRFEDIHPAKAISFQYSHPGRRRGNLSLDWIEETSRFLLISPFLSQELIEEVAERVNSSGDDFVLVSSEEALKALDWTKLESRCAAYSWDEELSSNVVAGLEEQDDSLGEESITSEIYRRLSGLHAKLFIAEQGSDSTLMLGSANATNAAFRGHNTEFMTVLEGRSKHIGIDAVMGSEVADHGIVRLVDFLRDFKPPSSPEERDENRELLRRDLEDARRYLASGDTAMRVTKSEKQGKFDITLTFTPMTRDVGQFPSTVKGFFWPASLEESRMISIDNLISGVKSSYEDLGPADVSRFIAFRLEATNKEGASERIGFVLGARFERVPDELEDLTLASFISKPANF